ncbi:MAG: agmatine deiminase family protein [Ignavibacteriaceae bacterium]|nr:agmatine deiminase family protein [Ignavibacteriaceae bacterium]
MKKENNFRLPAEWEKHEATWLGWPHNVNDWPGKITPVQWVYGEIVRKISGGEKVRILVQSKDQKKKVNKVLSAVGANLENIEYFKFESDRGWMRDSGPAFVKNGSETELVNFKFNAWAKYSNFKKDEKLPRYISKKLHLNKILATYNDKHVVLEGGSIDVNGSGTLITTEECLMDAKTQVRNPGFSKADYADVFKKYLGVTNVIWLGKGIAGDDTHGHVDDLCRFVNKNTVVVVDENNQNDKNYKPLKENIERLKKAQIEDGSKLNVIRLPMPAPLFFKGERLPASYANFYISNSAVLVPTFNDPNDRVALGILAELFSDREVVGIHSVDLVWGLGTIHCLTHEQPV